MPTRLRRRSRFAFLALPTLFLAIAGYFGWQGTRGDFSAESRAQLQAERAERQAELDGLIARREALTERVELLRNNALDGDLLDERARAQLFMVHPDEFVIVHERGPDHGPDGGLGQNRLAANAR